MRCYETSEMGNVIKYRTHVVLCLVVTLVFIVKTAETRTDGLDSRLFHIRLI